MDSDKSTIRQFLEKHPPLSGLPAAALDEIAEQVTIAQFGEGAVILKIGATNDCLYMIRKGAVEVADGSGGLIGRFGDGEFFGYRSLLSGGVVRFEVIALEDLLVYRIPSPVFFNLNASYPVFSDYFDKQSSRRLRGALTLMRRDTSRESLAALQLRSMVSKQPITVGSGATAQEAARLMTERKVSALLVAEEGKLLGIVSDVDFRSKIIAQGLDYTVPITDVMTPNPITISLDGTASEALVMMARYRLRHLPVCHEGQIAGVVSASDLLHHQSHNAIYLVNEIDEADSVEALAAISRQLPNVLVNLVRGSLTAHDTANTISLIGESICRRLLQLGEVELGPPPVPYAFVVCGSMARREQTAHSDQDNGMVISDEMLPEHDAYFLALAKYVSDGLNACGYVYCNGDVMATNPKWRLTYSQWRRNFDTWIDTPQPMALMYSSIFFDMRGVHGDVQMVKDLAGHVLAKTRASTIFLAHMARNAMQFQPPLGIFRQFVLEKGKDHGETLDLKKRGIMPVIDLVRVYALSVGTRSLNTCRRLEECERLGAISKSGSEDLRDALEFISTLRLEHQARQIEAGQKPDNFLSPESLSALERRHLKDAFEVVRTLQASAEQRYQLNRF